MEEPLPGLQRVLLRAHLAMCAGCRNFSRQAGLLRAISHRYTDALEREERKP
jgi:predicted anti-sigma-YlaC factor YlaD